MRTWIDIHLPNGGAKQGDGPIATATGVRIVRRLDRAGEFSFDTSAYDVRSALLVQRRTARIWGQAATGAMPTCLGAGTVEEVSMAPGGSDVELSVSGMDLASELAAVSVGFLKISVDTVTTPTHARFYNGAWFDWGNVRDDNVATTESAAGMTVGNWIYARAAAPFDAVDVDLSTFNSNAGKLECGYYNGTLWRRISCVDGTSVNGVPLAQDGRISWVRPLDWQQAGHAELVAPGYWIAIGMVSGTLDAAVDIREIDTVVADIPTATGPQLIMAHAPTWSLDVVRGYNTTATATVGQFAGQSVLAALVQLSEAVGEHFWIDSTTRQVVWKRNTWTASGFRAVKRMDTAGL